MNGFQRALLNLFWNGCFTEREYMKKLSIIGVFIAVVVAFFVFDLDKQFTLEGLKASMSTFTEIQQRSPFIVIAVFFFAYVVITAVSLPGAAIMTLAAGALFGLVWGTLIVSFASTLGATLAFLVSRYLLRDSLTAKFGDKLRAFNEGITREGAFYLFTLRLIPVVPFFLINLVMGLTLSLIHI